MHENKSVTKAEHELFPPKQLRRVLQALEGGDQALM